MAITATEEEPYTPTGARIFTITITTTGTTAAAITSPGVTRVVLEEAMRAVVETAAGAAEENKPIGFVQELSLGGKFSNVLSMFKSKDAGVGFMGSPWS